MNYILAIYSKEAFKEYILPSIDNADYEVTLRSKDFYLQDDITLHMEVFTEQWSIKS